MPENVSDSVNVVVNYLTDKVVEKISNNDLNDPDTDIQKDPDPDTDIQKEPKEGMQNGFQAVELAAENIADSIQPKSETMQQIEDLKLEEKGEKEKGGFKTRKYKRKKNNSKKRNK